MQEVDDVQRQRTKGMEEISEVDDEDISGSCLVSCRFARCNSVRSCQVRVYVYIFFQLLRECRVGALMREFVLQHCDPGSILRLTWGLSLSTDVLMRVFRLFSFDKPSLKAVCFAISLSHFPNKKGFFPRSFSCIQFSFYARASCRILYGFLPANFSC